MIIRERVHLSPLTTFKIGGPSRYFAEASTQKDIEQAVTYAQSKALPLRVLGGGSNILIPDEGIGAFVVHIRSVGVRVEERGEEMLLTASAGMSWDEIVSYVANSNGYGIENLAGIPGTLGGAVVQNIGAYGAELKDVFVSAKVFDMVTNTWRQISRDEAAFGYRTSLFKKHKNLVIGEVTLKLMYTGELQLTYPDLLRAREAGTTLATPHEVGTEVRRIRAGKFPDITREGTAGSFFKNPIVSTSDAALLGQKFPGIKQFVLEDGRVKVALAWILDHVLHLNGYARGRVRLFEKQPLVIVASPGATAHDVDVFANDVRDQIQAATDIRIEREVELFGI